MKTRRLAAALAGTCLGLAAVPLMGQDYVCFARTRDDITATWYAPVGPDGRFVLKDVHFERHRKEPAGLRGDPIEVGFTMEGTVKPTGTETGYFDLELRCAKITTPEWQHKAEGVLPGTQSNEIKTSLRHVEPKVINKLAGLGVGGTSEIYAISLVPEDAVPFAARVAKP